MEAWDAIRARRNVRQYRPDPVSDADLERIVEAARRAPSARNNQHWDFVVATDRAQLQQLSMVWLGAAHIASAPAAIALVVPEPEDEREKLIDQFDLGQAMMAMTIAATDLDIGTGHSWVDDQDKAAPSWAFPTITSSPTSSASVTPPIVGCSRTETQPSPLHRSVAPRALVNRRTDCQ